MELVKNYIDACKKLSPVWKTIQAVSWAVLIVSGWALVSEPGNYSSQAKQSKITTWKLFESPASTFQTVWLTALWLAAESKWWGFEIALPVEDICKNTLYCIGYHLYLHDVSLQVKK